MSSHQVLWINSIIKHCVSFCITYIWIKTSNKWEIVLIWAPLTLYHIFVLPHLRLLCRLDITYRRPWYCPFTRDIFSLCTAGLKVAVLKHTIWYNCDNIVSSTATWSDCDTPPFGRRQTKIWPDHRVSVWRIPWFLLSFSRQIWDRTSY